MEPEFQYNLNRNFKLRIIIAFLVGVLLLLGSYTQKKSDENRSLKASMALLQATIEHQKEKNQSEFDSLQQLIRHQEKLHLRLKDSLALLKSQRLHLKKRADENKAAILRLHDLDSLYDAVARHYFK